MEAHEQRTTPSSPIHYLEIATKNYKGKAAEKQNTRMDILSEFSKQNKVAQLWKEYKIIINDIRPCCYRAKIRLKLLFVQLNNDNINIKQETNDLALFSQHTRLSCVGCRYKGCLQVY